MITSIAAPWSIALTLFIFIIFLLIDRWVSSRSMLILSERSVRRFVFAQVRVLIVVGFISGAAWLMTGLNVVGQTLFAYLFALLFSVIMDFAWEFASPYSITTLQKIARRKRKNPGKHSRLLRIAGLAHWVILVVMGILVFLPISERILTGLVLMSIMGVAFTYFIPEYYLISFYIGDPLMNEEDRTTALFILVRDPLPVFVFLGVLANLWRTAGPAGIAPNPRMQLAWLLLMGLIFIVALYGLIQYQKGANLLRRRQEQALDDCMKMLDRMEGTLTFARDGDWLARLETLIRQANIPTVQDLPQPFTPKALYEVNADQLPSLMVTALRQQAPESERGTFLAYVQGLKKSVAEERKNLKESRPVVFEVTVTAVSVISSTILAKLAETIFETIQ